MPRPRRPAGGSAAEPVRGAGLSPSAAAPARRYRHAAASPPLAGRRKGRARGDRRQAPLRPVRRAGGSLGPGAASQRRGSCGSRGAGPLLACCPRPQCSLFRGPGAPDHPRSRFFRPGPARPRPPPTSARKSVSPPPRWRPRVTRKCGEAAAAGQEPEPPGTQVRAARPPLPPRTLRRLLPRRLTPQAGARGCPGAAPGPGARYRRGRRCRAPSRSPQRAEIPL